MIWNSDPLNACFTLTFCTLTSFLHFFFSFFTLFGWAYRSLLLWRLANIVLVSSTSMQSCSRAHGNCTASTRGVFLVTFFCRILFSQCKKTEGETRCIIWKIYISVTWICLHTWAPCWQRARSRICRQRRWRCRAFLAPGTRAVHSLCSQRSGPWKQHRDPFYWTVTIHVNLSVPVLP